MTTWHRVLSATELPEGRVTTVAAGHKSIALVHYDGQFSALDNHCPHQGGPLGEGSIENGLLRCPWHGFDYCPLNGKTPGFDDEATTYPLEIRDGQVFVAVREEDQHEETVADVMVRTMVNWGVTHVFGMVGHSNLGLADALRRREQDGELAFIGIRHEGAAAFAASAFGKLTGRPAACLTIAGPGATNLLTACGTRRSTAPRSSRSPARSTPRCSARARFRRAIWRARSGPSPPGARPCSAHPTTPS